MASVTNQKNIDLPLPEEKRNDLEAQKLEVLLEEVKENKELKIKGKDSVVTDIIIILDESGSMASMGKEPVRSVDAFIQEQKKNADDDATLTLMTFNTKSTRVIDNQHISEVKNLQDELYAPCGSTALNDAVCQMIDHKLNSDKPDNVVLLIITDGEENSSNTFSTANTRERIEKVQKDHDWKVMFIGANIDAFAEGRNLSVNSSMCAQYDQNLPDNLLFLMRTTSEQVSDYRRDRTNGDNEAELKAPRMNIYTSEPNRRSTRDQRSYLRSSTYGLRPPPHHELTLLGAPLTLTRTLTGVGF